MGTLLLFRQLGELGVQHEPVGVVMVFEGCGVVETDLTGEKIVKTRACHHVLPQRYRSVFGHDDGGGAAHGVEPGAKFLGIGDGGGQCHQLHSFGKVNDDFFPDRSTESVGEIVHLVHDHIGEVGERRRIGVDHVAQHFGGHDYHLGVRIYRGVSGEQPHVLRTVARHEFAVFLVAERLDRCRIERFAALAQGLVDSEFAHDRLAGPGGCCHQDGAALFQMLAGFALEAVKFKVEGGGEASQIGAVLCGTLSGLSVSFGRTALVIVDAGGSAHLLSLSDDGVVVCLDLREWGRRVFFLGIGLSLQLLGTAPVHHQAQTESDGEQNRERTA